MLCSVFSDDNLSMVVLSTDLLFIVSKFSFVSTSKPSTHPPSPPTHGQPFFSCLTQNKVKFKDTMHNGDRGTH